MTTHASTRHWHAEPWPFFVGFGAGLFLPWAFMLQFVYGQSLLAIIAASLAALLLLAGGIGWAGATVGVIKDEGWSPAAMLMFIGTEVMTILGLLAGYWTMRLQADLWPPAGSPELSPPYVSTLILISSSFTVGLARRQQLAGNAGGFANMTLLTVLLWVVFGAITIMTWVGLANAGVSIDTNAYTTALYGMTGIHFAHIVFGVLILLLAVRPAFQGRMSPSYARSMSMYVHFVNVLGVWVFLQVYLW
ncbi:MAG TPA: hypothetical protein ENJ19_01730 [Gammaproteobacteria bacterium]|nr:hypothetical protein [Gammaproteobacteria bacterium]